MKALILIAALLGLSQFASASAYTRTCIVEQPQLRIYIPMAPENVIALLGNPEHGLNLVHFPADELQTSNISVLETLSEKSWSEDGISYHETKTYEEAKLQMKDGSPIPFLEYYQADSMWARMTCTSLSSAKEIVIP